MNAYRVTFVNGWEVTVVATNKAHAYRVGCRTIGTAPTVLTRNIVALPRPKLAW